MQNPEASQTLPEEILATVRQSSWERDIFDKNYIGGFYHILVFFYLKLRKYNYSEIFQ